MILTINIDLGKLPDDVTKRCLALVDVFHQLAHDVAVQGNGPYRTSKIHIQSFHRGPVSERIGEWEINYDTGIDS